MSSETGEKERISFKPAAVCVDRLGADGGRMQRASFSRANLALLLTACDCCAMRQRRVPAEHRLRELKEHTDGERVDGF